MVIVLLPIYEHGCVVCRQFASVQVFWHEIVLPVMTGEHGVQLGWHCGGGGGGVQQVVVVSQSQPIDVREKPVAQVGSGRHRPMCGRQSQPLGGGMGSNAVGAAGSMRGPAIARRAIAAWYALMPRYSVNSAANPGMVMASSFFAIVQ
jgi:hypothetical protein